MPFSPVQSARKFSAVYLAMFVFPAVYQGLHSKLTFGTTSLKSSKVIRRAGKNSINIPTIYLWCCLPLLLLMAISKKTLGLRAILTCDLANKSYLSHFSSLVPDYSAHCPKGLWVQIKTLVYCHWDTSTCFSDSISRRNGKEMLSQSAFRKQF